VKLLLNYVKFI